MNVESLIGGARSMDGLMNAMSAYRASVTRGGDGEKERRSAHDNLDAFFDHVAALILAKGEQRG